MKKKEIIIIITVIIFATIIFILSNFGDKFFQRNKKEDKTPYQSWYDMEVSDDPDTYGYDLEYTPPTTYVSIPNANLVYDYLTLNAISTLQPTCESFLFENGYKEARILHIQEDTISGDKSYVVFTCSINEYPNTHLQVTYKTNDKAYALEIK